MSDEIKSEQVWLIQLEQLMKAVPTAKGETGFKSNSAD